MSRKNPKTPEYKPSRPRAAFPIAESIGQAAAWIGASEAVLKAAKRNGSKAFLTHGRVDIGELLPFLFKMLTTGNDLPSGFSSWKEVLEAERAKREAIKRQQDEKSVMLTADAERQAAEAMGMVFAELERRDRELPPGLAGLDAVSVYKRMNADTESIRRNLKAKFAEIGK